MDTVIGQKSNTDCVLLTIIEHKNSYDIVLDIVAKAATAVTDAIKGLRTCLVNISVKYQRA